MINDLDIVQWDYLLSPEFEMINSAGKPLTGGYIEVYIHGTRNKYYCASDFNGTLHPFQIPLDSIGSNVILASPENAYDVYVYNKFGSLIMSRYNVHCQGGNGGSSTYVGDKLFYGQYRASNVTTIANLNRNKGNINLTSNGYLKLKNGMSYHITVRGAFQVDDVTNTDTTLNYIEYTSVNPIKIDIDETKEGPQYFELSYDIYRLPEDMDYQVAFAQSNGMVTELLVEVHSLSNLATSAAGGDQEYEPGWGIDITNNVISVDPSILDDYVTEEELFEIVTGITGLIPEDVATHTEVYEATVTAIEYVTGMIPQSQVQSDWDETDDTQPSYIQNKPDLDIYATHDEVNTVSGQIIETVNNVSGDIIETVNNVSAILHGEIENIPEQQQADWAQTDDTQVDYIKNKPDLSIYATHDEVVSAVSSIDLSEYATHTEVYDSTVTAVQLATGLIPDSEEVQFEEINLSDYALASAIPDVSDFTTHDEVHESIVSALEYVTGIIPDAQVQSDWTETNTTDPSYIQNKPEEYDLHAGQNIGIFVDGTDVTIAASGADLSGYATESDVHSATVTAINLVTGMIPEAPTYTAGDNIVIDNNEISLSDVVQIDARPDAASGYLLIGNVVHWGGQDYGPGWIIRSHTDNNKDYHCYNTSDQGRQDFYWGEYADDRENNTVYAESFIGIEEGDIYYKQGEFQPTSTLPVIWSCSQMAQDIAELQASGVTQEQLQDAVELVTGLIPDTSDMATQTWVNNQGFLTSIPDTYATDSEVSEAIASSVTGFVTESQVTALIPDSEEVQFEELDITQFAQVSAIPVVTGFATKSELSDVQATIPTIQLNGDDQVTAINNHEIAGTGGTTYTAGDYISIENDEISVTGLEPLPEIVEMDALEIKAGTNIAIVTGVSDITISVTGIETPDTEDVTFEEINIANYALASAIPDVSNFVTDTEVTTEITEAVSGKQDLLTGITDVQVVTGLPASPTQDVLYLIVEA